MPTSLVLLEALIMRQDPGYSPQVPWHTHPGFRSSALKGTWPCHSGCDMSESHQRKLCVSEHPHIRPSLTPQRAEHMSLLLKTSSDRGFLTFQGRTTQRTVKIHPYWGGLPETWALKRQQDPCSESQWRPGDIHVTQRKKQHLCQTT